MTSEPVWHPPRAVLEVAELVLTGALPRHHAATGLLRAPDGIAAPSVLLEDCEGTPVARLAADGSLESGRAASHGPLRTARRSPHDVRRAIRERGVRVTAVPVAAAPTQEQADIVRRATSADPDAAVLWLVLVGDGRRVDLPPHALLRAVERVAADVAPAGAVVPVAVPFLGPDGDRDLIECVARCHGADAVLDLPPARGPLHAAAAHELARAVPPPHRRGVTVFLTGLSGSGKSTVAKGLAEAIQARGDRAVSLLDGDEIRRLLSSGLGFSREDRDLNVRRIGFVAAEVTRHRGIAICAPIAPFAQARAQVRADVEEVGDFVLVHVATPLAECERRDRKGLYARARSGLVPEFTGISSPYEPPTDADLVLDTTGVGVDDAIGRVLSLLAARGYLGRSAGQLA